MLLRSSRFQGPFVDSIFLLYYVGGRDVLLKYVFHNASSFTTNVDLYLAMALLDVTELGKFYVVTGEEYFKTSWG